MPAPESARRPNIDVIIGDRRTQRLARKVAEQRRQQRRQDIAANFIIVPFVAMTGSGLIWLTAEIWMHMPWL